MWSESRGGGEGLGWVCERELREGLGGQPLHLPDGVVISTDRDGKQWRTAIEVELTRKTEARVVAILRQLLATYDDVVYRVHPSALTVVTRSVAGLRRGRSRIIVRPYRDPEGGRPPFRSLPPRLTPAKRRLARTPRPWPTS